MEEERTEAVEEKTVTTAKGLIRRSDEEMARLREVWHRREKAAISAEAEIDSRIYNPCAACQKSDTCRDIDRMQAWRDEQRPYAKRDKRATFKRTCGSRLPEPSGEPQLFDLKGDKDADGKTVTSGEIAGMGLQEDM